MTYRRHLCIKKFGAVKLDVVATFETASSMFTSGLAVEVIHFRTCCYGNTDLVAGGFPGNSSATAVIDLLSFFVVETNVSMLHVYYTFSRPLVVC
ncbi:hypothetical protein Deiofobo_0296 [Pseudomonas phage Deifobo]|nr:hypothetical protein Deiofobo_0296 [Pseudomonas phage Deifobo]